MRIRSIQQDGIDDLVTRYADAASAHGAASQAGNHQAANRQYDIVSAIFRELRTRGRQDALLPLLKSQDRDVKAWAAAHALTFAPDRGRHVLEQLSKESGIVALEAKMTLREWRAGRLKFP